MKISKDGIVIWETKTGEADRVITVLTPDGIITAYARGSLRPNSRLASATAMLSLSNFELSSGKNMYTVADAFLKNRFVSLFSDVEGYALSVYFCELLKYLSPVDDDASEYLSLILNALYLLNSGHRDKLLVKAAFEMRIMSVSGYMPDVAACAGCGRETDGEVHFDILGGICYCDSCSAARGERLNCSRAMLSAMKYILSSDLSAVFSFNLPEKTLKSLNELTSRFVSAHMERSLATLDFFNSIAER